MLIYSVLPRQERDGGMCTLYLSSSPLIDVSTEVVDILFGINPFTAPACKISGLYDANSVFSGPVTSIFNAMRFDGNPLTCQCEKGGKKA